jgi:cell division protein FtsN
MDKSYPKRGTQDLHPRELSFWNEERFYQESPSPSIAPLRFVILVASLIIIATFGWLALRWLTAPQVTNPPFIYAEPGPYKIPSDSPGGMHTPYQDKDVYNRFHHNPGGGQPVENLLPPPETPMPSTQQHPPPPNQGYEAPYSGTPQNYAAGTVPAPPQQYPPPEAHMPPAQQYAQQPPPAAYAATAQQPPVQQYGPSQAAGYAAAPPPSPTPLQAPPTAATPPAAHQSTQTANIQVLHTPEESNIKARSNYLVKPPVKIPSRAYRIQVATLVGKAFANKEVARIRAHTALVGSATITAQKVEGTTGIYRVVLGPFNSRKEAIERCDKFRNNGFSCIVLHPEKAASTA